jgi:hypothetical protein
MHLRSWTAEFNAITRKCETIRRPGDRRIVSSDLAVLLGRWRRRFSRRGFRRRRLWRKNVSGWRFGRWRFDRRFFGRGVVLAAADQQYGRRKRRQDIE